MPNLKNVVSVVFVVVNPFLQVWSAQVVSYLVFLFIVHYWSDNVVLVYVSALVLVGDLIG